MSSGGASLCFGNERDCDVDREPLYATEWAATLREASVAQSLAAVCSFCGGRFQWHPAASLKSNDCGNAGYESLCCQPRGCSCLQDAPFVKPRTAWPSVAYW